MRSSRGGDSAAKKTELRVHEVSRLASRLDDEATAALFAALRDPSAYVAKLAVDALAERASYTLCAALRTEFAYFQADGASRDPGCYLRTAIAHIWGKQEYLHAADALRIGVSTVQIESAGGVSVDMGTQLRAACALALAEIRDPNALGDITPLLFDTGRNGIVLSEAITPLNPELRLIAARAIGRLGDLSGIAVLSIKLRFPGDERDNEVLAECLDAAMTLGKARALALVEPYIIENYRGLAPAAAIAIIRADVDEGYPLVATAVTFARGNDLKAICLTLASKRSMAAMTLLYDLAASERDDERAAFAEASGVTRDRGAVPALTVLAGHDRSPKVQSAAKAALAAIGA